MNCIQTYTEPFCTWNDTTGSQVTRADFQPGNWQVKGDKGQHIIDRTTNRVFGNDNAEELYCRNLWFIFYGILHNPFLSSCCLLGRTARLFTCYHCWKPDPTKSPEKETWMPTADNGSSQSVTQDSATPMTREDRMRDTAIEAAKCVCTPFMCLAAHGMNCATICYNTNNNKKYIHSLDRLQFDGYCGSEAFWPEDIAAEVLAAYMEEPPTAQIMTTTGKNDKEISTTSQSEGRS